jgi:glycosyltransferase involved in cell wall biosynthesis
MTIASNSNMIHAVSPPDATVDVSVIVPVGERHARDLYALHAEYRNGLRDAGARFEFIYVLDGGQTKAEADLERLLQEDHTVSVIYLSRSFGESTALMAGFERAAGQRILTLPAYHQIEAREIPKLLAGLESADVIVCRRQPRAGGIFERVRRNAFHGLVNRMTRLQLHDLGCSARGLKRQVLEEVVLYGDQHRLLPALADRQGFRVREIDVAQSSADRFEEGYSTKEYAHRMLDLFAVFFLVRFTKKPLRFFGMVGATTLILGSILLLYLVTDRLVFDHSLANRPALLLSSLLVVLGLQLFALGLLGELIIFTHARGLKDYQIDRIIEFPGDGKSQ